MKLKNIVILLLSAALTACGYYRDDYTQSQPQVFGSIKPLSYQNINALLFRNRCLECHSEAGRNRGRVNLESYEKVKKFAKDALDQIEMGLMPDDSGPSVSKADRQVLQDWVDAGYPF